MSVRTVLTPSAILALLFLTTVGCSAPETSMRDLDLDPQVMAQADREFAADTAARGLDGWLAWFTPGAAKLDMRNPPVMGQAAIAESDGPLFADPSLQLSWEPEVAEWLEPGRRGFTNGPWTLTQRDAEGATSVLASGRYLTVWVLTDDGWRAELDAGVPDA
jgi:ketosteroid isomerase-like protein